MLGPVAQVVALGGHRATMMASRCPEHTFATMTPRPISPDALRIALRTDMQAGAVDVPGTGGSTDSPLLYVDLDQSTDGSIEDEALTSSFPVVVVGLTALDPPETHPAARLCDAVVTGDSSAADAIAAKVAAQPIAATALVQVLRGSEGRSLDDGLLLESAVYSTLQAGPEFARWLASRGPRPRPGPAERPAVEIARHRDRLEVTLSRPHVRNALDTAMRDELTEALRLVAMDDTIEQVHLRGAGPSFCAGGDLDEFGSFPDPATAHIVRQLQSAGRALAAVAERVTVHLHGACVGSGIELPAFAGTVVAAPDTTIALPEVALGLIPGAGGTLSLPRRIGRHRTARLALTGEHIDTTTALDWGLADTLETGSQNP